MKNMLNVKEDNGLVGCSFSSDENVAFIKKDIHDGKSMWLICGADGVKIAATDDRDFAFLFAKQNDLLAFSVH